MPEADLDLLRIAEDDPRRDLVRMDHPMSAEMAVMRRSMLPGLLRAAARNQAHQRADGGLFEIGRTYTPAARRPGDRAPWLAAVRWGREGTEGWRADAAPGGRLHGHRPGHRPRADRPGSAVETRPNAARYFHPVRQARLVAGEAVVGWAAEVHPLVLRAFEVDGPVAAVVLDLEALLAAQPGAAQYEDLLTVPVSTRDLALVVAEDVPSADLVAAGAGAPARRWCATCASSTATRASRWARATSAWRCACRWPTRGAP